MSVGAVCKMCELLIENWNSAERRKWCEDMRKLLILNGLRPEDYHHDCFIDRVTGFVRQANTADAGAHEFAEPI